MKPAKRIGRIIGILLFVQLASGLLVYFVLLRPLTTPPGFLANAVGSSLQIGVAVLLSLVTGALTLGIAIAGWPLFRQHSCTMALWLLALGVVSFPLCAAENVTVLSMLSLSQWYAQAGAADGGLFEALGAVLRSAQKWTHATYALVGSGVFFILYGILYRFALSPRALAASGLVAALLHLSAYTVPFLGVRSLLILQLPLALSNLAVALWLMGKGFEGRPHPVRR